MDCMLKDRKITRQQLSELVEAAKDVFEFSEPGTIADQDTEEKIFYVYNNDMRRLYDILVELHIIPYGFRNHKRKKRSA